MNAFKICDKVIVEKSSQHIKGEIIFVHSKGYFVTVKLANYNESFYPEFITLDEEI